MTETKNLPVIPSRFRIVADQDDAARVQRLIRIGGDGAVTEATREAQLGFCFVRIWGRGRRFRLGPLAPPCPTTSNTSGEEASAASKKNQDLHDFQVQHRPALAVPVS
jgi:hypothetical protein